MNRYFIWSVVLLLFPASMLAVQPADSARGKKTEIMPVTHLVGLFTADTRAHRFNFVKTDYGHEFVAGIGGVFPVLRIAGEKRKYQFSVASTLYTTLYRWNLRGRLVNADFFVDFFFDIRWNERWAIRTGTGHTSHHLSDDAVIDLKRTAINYLRDYFQAFACYTTANGLLHVYGGPILNANFKTTENLSPKLMLQTGFEQAFMRKGDRAFYLAADIKFRGEFNFATTHNLQLGYRYGNTHGRVFRLALNRTAGYEERGQFYTEQRTISSMGIYLDF